jgi:hypothetical protein
MPLSCLPFIFVTYNLTNKWHHGLVTCDQPLLGTMDFNTMHIMKQLLLVTMAFALFARSVCGETSNRWTAILSPAGSVRLERDGKELGTMLPGLFEAPWQLATLNAGNPGATATNNVYWGQIHSRGGAMVDTELHTIALAAGAQFAYKLTPQRTMKLDSLNVTLTLPVTGWVGGKFIADDHASALPIQFTDTQLWSAPTKSLQLIAPDGAALRLDFLAPTHVLVQDDRQWVELHVEHAGQYATGTGRSCDHSRQRPLAATGCVSGH